jgi:hypothetical protein
MESVAPAARSEVACSGCLKPSKKLTSSSGDQLCEKCKTVFITAAVLLNEDITAEDTLIPTLVFAKIAGGSPEYSALVEKREAASGMEIARFMHAAMDWPPRRSQTPAEYAKTLREYVQAHGYGGWELVCIARGVPILRVRPLVALPETHPDTQILKSVRIQVLSRHVKPAEVSASYERLLTDSGVRWDENNSGFVKYRLHEGFLEVAAGLEGKVSPLMAESVGADSLYSWPAYNFPPPGLVADIYESLLGKVHKRTGRGFAYALDLYDKPQSERSAKKIILAFAAWHIGEGPSARIPPKSRPRVARVLNKQLLDPSEHLPENTWSPENKVWRDVEELAMRFVRLYAGGPGAFFPGT